MPDQQQRELSPAEVAKIEAETRKLEQELAIEQTKAKAEVIKLEAEARKATAEAEQLETVLIVSRLEKDNIARMNEENLALDKFHHVYRFNGEVNSKSVDECIKRLTVWQRTGATKVEIVFASGGGSVIDGLILFDFIQTLRREGMEVVTGTLGMAASMAGILLQAGDTRWMGKEAWVLIHEVQAAMMGTMGQIEDRHGWLKRIQERILDIFAERALEAKKNGTAAKALSRKNLSDGWIRKDWWLSSDDCLKGGIVDEVR